MTVVDSQEWHKFTASHPQAHLLQMAEWGELKSDFGWEAVRVISGGSGAQILFRSLPMGFSFAYIPKGPVGEDWEGLWPGVDRVCRSRRAVFLKVEPDAWEGDDAGERLREAGFRPSLHAIQPRQTLVLDIRGEEDDILAQMKQKTRYNIRLAGRKGVVVNASSDIEGFSRMMDTTGERDAFGVHNLAYYQRAYELFHPVGACELLAASFEDALLAALMIFAKGERAWYFYGASTNQHRNKMPTYLLQWAAILWAKSKGCTQYDLWGIPDADEETLEAQFTQRADGLWGVYRFKRGFGGELMRSASAWDRVYNPVMYTAYRLLMARRGMD
ncbi:MAG: peptidoglycan bridge formation glycyltransferase FemA/FemB family protein [Anaerolineales bacterium]